jgi:hypothetical protein
MAKRPAYSRARAATHQGDDAAALEKVKATLPPGANVDSVLEAVSKFWADFKSGNSRLRPDAKLEQKRSKQIRDDAHALAANIRAAKRSLSRQEHLAALEQIESEFEESALYWGAQLRAHSRRADPRRALLYWCALQIWTRDARGDLIAWVGKNDNASQAILFLLAVVGPMLGNRTPTLSAARHIVQREKANRDREHRRSQRAHKT